MTHLVELNLGPTQKFVIAVGSREQGTHFSTTRPGRDVIYIGEKAAALVTTDRTDPGARHPDFGHAQNLVTACKQHGAGNVMAYRL